MRSGPQGRGREECNDFKRGAYSFAPKKVGPKALVYQRFKVTTHRYDELCNKLPFCF